MIPRKLSPAEECFTLDSNLEGAKAVFLKKYGYPATEDRKYLLFLRLGPIYDNLITSASQSLRAGNIILYNGSWRTIEDIDGNTVLDSEGNLLDLPELVKVRADGR